jgi:hypothetical protein
MNQKRESRRPADLPARKPRSNLPWWILLFGIALRAAVMAYSAPTEPLALEILDKADDKWDNPLKNALTEMEFSIYRDKALRKTYRMAMKYQDSDHVLVETLFPPRNEGEKMLQAGRRNYWIFLPNINRAVRMSESNSLSNSDFSNTDILSPRLSKEYTPTAMGVEKFGDVAAYKLELVAKKEDAAYARIIYWIRKSDCFPLRRDYYTFSGQLLKRLDFAASMPPKPGLPPRFPDLLSMRSVLEKDKETILRVTKWTPGTVYPADAFQESALMKR